MKYPPFSSSVLPFFQVSILFLIRFADPLSQISSSYSDCSSFFHCGIFTNISYPFWGGHRPKHCGHPELSLSCNNNFTTIQIVNVNYQVLYMNPNTQMLMIARQDLKDGICSSQILTTTLNSELFEYGDGYENLTLLYGCEPFPLPAAGEFSCPGYGTGYLRLGDVVDSTACEKRMVIPVRSDLSVNPWNVSEVDEAIGGGFEVKLKVETQFCVDCIKSYGVCGFDWENYQPTCFCRNQMASYLSGPCSAPPPPPPPPPPPANTEKKNQLPLKIGIGAGGAAILCLFLGCILYVAKRRKEHKMQEKHVSLPHFSSGVSNPTTNLSQSIPSFPYSKSDLESGSTNYGVQVFNYMELEEATKNFDPSRELGEGGFGTVYYGKLSDGREVAVKRLYESNLRRAEQFKNELEILTRLHHPNLVKLYGSTSRRSQELLLVYEYIPNGTVADHLHGKQVYPKLLNWHLRLRIAIETADALAYLHHSDVIHRDVKTNNILLDDNFQVKVADFGLSRLFPTNVTHVSTAPQGTPGYVDPEYYQVYQLTDKSDVFSFGVVLIELISSLEAVDMNRHRHDINLSNMAINKIQCGALHELVDPNLGFETDLCIRRMITSVSELAFRCLQQDKEMRPSMDEALEILKGIENEESGTRQAEVVDISRDDVRLLKNLPPPLSPDSVTTDKLVSTTTTDGSF